MTFGEALWRLLLLNWALFAAVAVVASGFTATLMWLVMRDGSAGRVPASDESLLDVSYAAGVVRVGGDR